MEDRFQRLERLLGLLLLNSMKGLSQQEKAHQLNLAGLTNVEIADLLETSSQVIAQHLYARRKARRSKKN
jgi:hypothetical protein